jgi:homoserine O-acetyltransferase
LQEVRNPVALLHEILRVGRKAIISFPNFGFWKVRAELLLGGRMPKSENLPFEWHNTPNIHLFTLHDFTTMCAKEKFRIEILHCLGNSTFGNVLQRLGLRNLGAEQVVALITRAEE